MLKALLQLVVVLGFAYGALLAYAYFFQERLVYFPGFGGGSTAAPTDVGLDYEEVRFRTADDLRLHGWYVPARPELAVLLFMHGNAGDITHRLDTLRMFHDMGLSTFLFDYRGYGRSEGRPTEQGTYRDAEAAWRWLVEERGVPPDRIVVFGRSLGAAIGAWLASHREPAALIIESAFTSAPDLARRHYGFLPVGLLARIHYDTRRYIRELDCPVLILHSVDDEIVPFAHGRELYEAAPQPKQFGTLQGGHNESFFASYPEYRRLLSEFLDRHGPRPVVDPG